MCFVFGKLSHFNLYFAVNGAGCGVGTGSTFQEAKEDAARHCLRCLRGVFGVKEGVLMEQIPMNPNIDANEPPQPQAISIELVTKSELHKRKKKELSSPSLFKYLKVLRDKCIK
jgi:hypothetical protein